MAKDALPHKSRYEFKYVVRATKIGKFLEQIREVMQLDPHAVAGKYEVNSMYYDTRLLDAYFEKLDGIDRRYKIRIRYYGDIRTPQDWAKTALFFEAKHRIDQLIVKDRLRITPELALEFLESECLSVGDYLEQPEAAAIKGLVSKHVLIPTSIVSYDRVPYVCRIDPTLRVTVDTNLTARRPDQLYEDKADCTPNFLPPDHCILEVKFHNAIPLWLLEILRSNQLLLRRYSKYCSAVEHLYPEIGHRNVQFDRSIR